MINEYYIPSVPDAMAVAAQMAVRCMFRNRAAYILDGVPSDKNEDIYKKHFEYWISRHHDDTDGALDYATRMVARIRHEQASKAFDDWCDRHEVSAIANGQGDTIVISDDTASDDGSICICFTDIPKGDEEFYAAFNDSYMHQNQ